MNFLMVSVLVYVELNWYSVSLCDEFRENGCHYSCISEFPMRCSTCSGMYILILFIAIRRLSNIEAILI